MTVEKIKYFFDFFDLIMGDSRSFEFGVSEGGAGHPGVALIDVRPSDFSHE